MTLFHDVSFLSERDRIYSFDITVLHVLPAVRRPFSKTLIAKDRNGSSVAYVSFLE
jgi:hypothetical protein